MATFRVNPGKTRTTQQVLGNDDKLVVFETGTLATTSAPAVLVTAGTTRFSLNNQGTISVTGANGAALQGALAGNLSVLLENQVGATIRGLSRAIELTSATGSTGVSQLVNKGLIDGGTGIAVDFDGLRATEIRINVALGGTITNAGTADVLRPGNDLSGTITVVNRGTIRAGVV
jgi:hypothetical protein